ncbi:MAG: hypothetical protein JMDDDDMK_00776 [Acidobacteria bacterium]|nr:hypothetical protein [Acidobacteriota bacterium]
MDFHFHLDGRFLPVRFGGNLGDLALVFSIRVSVGRDDARLARTELGEIVLVDVEFDLKVVQVGHRNDVTFRAAITGETRRNEFAALDVAFQNDAGDRSADDGVFQLRLREGQTAFGLFDLSAHRINVFAARACANQRVGLFKRREPRNLRVVAGLRVIERLLRHNALLDQRPRAIERHAGVFQIGANLFKIGLAARRLFGARTVLQSGQPRLERIQLPLGFGHARAKLFVFQPDQRLALFDTVAFLDADPGDAA